MQLPKSLSKKLLLGKETVTNFKLIPENFINFFTEIGPKLASKMEKPAKTFDVYLKKVAVLQPEYPLSTNELKDPFFSLQTNKSPGHDEISFDVIKSCFGSLSKPLLHIFRLSLEEGIFPDVLKTAKVTPIFKTGDKNDFGNYRPISVLSCFSKKFEKIMYKRLFNHVSEHNLLYHKQFCFQQGHSTDHAIMQLIDQNDKFENNCFTLGIFIDLSKAFDTVNHQFLISKLANYR